MNVSLKPGIQQFVDELVKTGRYNSSADVLEEAIVRMMEEEASNLDEATQQAIDRSEEQIKEGRYSDWKKTSDELRAKYLNR